MVNAATVTAAILAFISLALLAVSLATNSWIRFDTSKSNTITYEELNPSTINTDLAGLQLRYSLEYFGLWVGCYREDTFNKLSCGFISYGCNCTICWTRNRTERTCQNDQVKVIKNKCTAFRITRAFTIIATIFLIFGAALLLVATCVTNRNIVWSACILNSFSIISSIIAFIIFYTQIFRNMDLPNVANIAWSFIMLIVAWPLTTIATIFSILGALSTPAKPYGDYDQSE